MADKAVVVAVERRIVVVGREACNEVDTPDSGLATEQYLADAIGHSSWPGV
jgi:hypothetical protein